MSRRDLSKSRVFGHVSGYGPGHHFEDRAGLNASGVHVQVRAGIHGDSKPGGGAFSICINGGYEDNVDYGNKITYVGSGGQDKNKKQVQDQSPDSPPNRALLTSWKTQKPVRVIRGAHNVRRKSGFNPWAPSSGYDYDGLYVVDSFRMGEGKAGYQMCFFELRKIEEDDVNVASTSEEN